LWTDKKRARYDRDHLRYPSDLTDDEWTYVEPLIPPARHLGGVRRRTPLSVSGIEEGTAMLPFADLNCCFDSVGRCTVRQHCQPVAEVLTESLILGTGDLFDKFDDGPPNLRVANLHKGFGEMKSVRRCEIV